MVDGLSFGKIPQCIYSLHFLGKRAAISGRFSASFIPCLTTREQNYVIAQRHFVSFSYDCVLPIISGTGRTAKLKKKRLSNRGAGNIPSKTSRPSPKSRNAANKTSVRESRTQGDNARRRELVLAGRGQSSSLQKNTSDLHYVFFVYCNALAAMSFGTKNHSCVSACRCSRFLMKYFPGRAKTKSFIQKKLWLQKMISSGVIEQKVKNAAFQNQECLASWQPLQPSHVFTAELECF